MRFGVIHLPFCIDFHTHYGHHGNSVPDKGNDNSCLILEPSYSTMGLMSKDFAIQSLRQSVLGPHVCNAQTGSQASTVSSKSLALRSVYLKDW